MAKTSEYVKSTCSKICHFIENHHKNILHVWPAYQITEENKISFVVIVSVETAGLETIGYSLKIQVLNEYCPEAKYVMCSKTNVDISQTEAREIVSCIDKNAPGLMKQHKYLSIISGSRVRSKDYGKSTHTVTQEPCIALYVLTKGYIPIDEKPFQSHYDNISIDVREGTFKLQGKFASDFHDTLPLSCLIGSSNLFSWQTGSLGCFIDHPEYGLCGLTCAHVLLFPSKFEEFKKKEDGTISWEGFRLHDKVYQPPYSKWVIGKLVQALYSKGGQGNSGFEVAVFQIEERHPRSGEFPSGTNDDAGLCFNSGKTCGISRIGNKEVIKIGPVTDKTTGQFLLEKHSTAVRTIDHIINTHTQQAQITLFNQIEVTPSDIPLNNVPHPFAMQGDSGSLVFVKENQTDLVCIGIVEGGTSFGTTIVSPIRPILKRLDVPAIKCFEGTVMNRKLTFIEHKLHEVVQNQNTFSTLVSNNFEEMSKNFKDLLKELQNNKPQELQNKKPQSQSGDLTQSDDNATLV